MYQTKPVVTSLKIGDSAELNLFADVVTVELLMSHKSVILF